LIFLVAKTEKENMRNAYGHMSLEDFLLRAARKVFIEAHGVGTPTEDDVPVEILDRKGQVIAFGWVDQDGRPEFKPWCDRLSN
jgi:hypothetical protein